MTCISGPWHPTVLYCPRTWWWTSSRDGMACWSAPWPCSASATASSTSPCNLKSPAASYTRLASREQRHERRRIGARRHLQKGAMKVFGFAGYSGSGKTTLIEQLVPRLVQRGLRVSVVKHAHHDFDVDVPGKDSYRHRH